MYLSNESDEPVYFDNFQVTHERGRIVEENHYYSYGLKIAGISSKAAGSLQNKYGYQGDFSENDQETALDEFDLRHYDPQIGRWTTTDPYEEFASPYLGMENNPGNIIDMNGGSVDNWYKALGTNNIQWFDGTAEIAGFKNLGSELSAWYNTGDGLLRWTNFMNDGVKDFSLPEVSITGIKPQWMKGQERLYNHLLDDAKLGWRLDVYAYTHRWYNDYPQSVYDKAYKILVRIYKLPMIGVKRPEMILVY